MSAQPSFPASVANQIVFTIIYAVACLYHVCHEVKTLCMNIVGNRKRNFADNQKNMKLVVITGCDVGFGRLLAERLLESTDFLVLALTLKQESANELSSTYSKNPNLFAVKCDVTSDSETTATKLVAQKILKEHSAVLHTIVNNAGITAAGDFLFFENVQIYKQVMDVNFFGMLRVTQALLPLMVSTSQTHGGRIVNLSSVCGTSASHSNSPYNASKFAVEAWSDSLRQELKPLNIAVTKVRPGQFATKIQDEWLGCLLASFRSAPKSVQQLYGGKRYENKMDVCFKKMARELPEASLMVDTLCGMIGMDKRELKPHYWVGDDAHTFWRAWYSLPTSVADNVKSLLLPFGPLLENSDEL